MWLGYGDLLFVEDVRGEAFFSYTPLVDPFVVFGENPEKSLCLYASISRRMSEIPLCRELLCIPNARNNVIQRCSRHFLHQRRQMKNSVKPIVPIYVDQVSGITPPHAGQSLFSASPIN